MSIEIDFQGWYQCRLATDPDNYDERRGVRGWTFALADEPDLDRIIRFHGPIAHRSHAPSIGVWVDEVRKDGQPVHPHPLVQARVELLDSAVYEGRNGQIATSSREPIVPWHLRIEGGDIVIDALDPITLSNQTEVERRQPIRFWSNSSEVLTITGIMNPADYRTARAAALRADLEGETVELRRQALQFRLKELQMAGPGIRQNCLAFKMEYAFDLRGPNSLVDPNQAIGTNVTIGWRVAFWMGGWDADGLCGYVKGTLSIP
jgi:hypothetical protein